jgi:uncharacterized protein with HEPN domain
MPSTFERDEALLLLMLEIVEKIETFTNSIPSAVEFEKDVKVFDASMMNFIVIGELVLKLSDECLEKNKDVEWYKIRAFRNFAAHDYFGISPKIVWDIIKNHLPELKIKLKEITGK